MSNAALSILEFEKFAQLFIFRLDFFSSSVGIFTGFRSKYLLKDRILRVKHLYHNAFSIFDVNISKCSCLNEENVHKATTIYLFICFFLWNSLDSYFLLQNFRVIVFLIIRKSISFSFALSSPSPFKWVLFSPLYVKIWLRGMLQASRKQHFLERLKTKEYMTFQRNLLALPRYCGRVVFLLRWSLVLYFSHRS